MFLRVAAFVFIPREKNYRSVSQNLKNFRPVMWRLGTTFVVPILISRR